MIGGVGEAFGLGEGRVDEYLCNWLIFVCGGDRIRNKAKLKAFELVDPRNTELRSLLQKAEFANMAGDDIVDEDEGPTGSASDSE